MCPHKPVPRGSILLMTLWLVAVLSALAVAIARQVSLELRVVRFRVAQAQARAMAQGGIRLAAELLTRDQNEYDALDEAWAAPFTRRLPGQALDEMAPALTVTVIDEDRYLNLNLASLDELARLGLSQELAQLVIDDYDTEVEDLPNVVPAYQARNAPFTMMEQLLDLPGMTLENFKHLQLAVSPYVDAVQRKVNINTVTSQALHGVTEGIGTLDDIRPGGPKEHIFKDETAIMRELEGEQIVNSGTPAYNALIGRLTITSSVFSITAEGRVPRARSVVRAVVNRTATGTPEPALTVLAWRDG